MTLTQKKSVYLANNLGFSKSCKDLILPEITNALQALNYEVREPFADNNQSAGADMSLRTAYQVSLKDQLDVVRSDAVLLVLNGEPPDTGVYAEGGMASVLRKKTFILRDDFRICSDCRDFPVNLMALAGLPKDKQEMSRHLYGAVEELSDPEKALARFARGEDVYPFKDREWDELAEQYKNRLMEKVKRELESLRD